MQQTPAKRDRQADDATLIDAYLSHLHTVAAHLSPQERHVAKIEQRQAQADDQPMVYSIASVKADYFNERFLHRIFSICGWDWKQRKKSPLYQQLREYGRIAA